MGNSRLLVATKHACPKIKKHRLLCKPDRILITRGTRRGRGGKAVSKLSNGTKSSRGGCAEGIAFRSSEVFNWEGEKTVSSGGGGGDARTVWPANRLST